MLLQLVWSKPARVHPIRWLVEAGDDVVEAAQPDPLPAQFVNIPASPAEIAAAVDDAIAALDIPQIYEHVQAAPLATWTVNHNFGRAPASVRVLSIGGVEMIADVVETSVNQVVISFAAPISGRAVLI